MRIFLYLLTPLLSFTYRLCAQTVEGTVIDRSGEPIGFVTVIMQETDSVFIAAVIAPEDGKFRFDRSPERCGRLIFQHLSYKTFVHEFCMDDIGEPLEIILEESGAEIDEVVVRATAPVVTVEGSALVYNGENLRRGRVVSTAYDMLLEVAGVYEEKEIIMLLGAGAPKIILNGEINSMPTETLYMMLRSIPAEEVEDIQVMYNAPSRYNTRGALINIQTKKGVMGERSVVGELSAGYTQSHSASGSGNGALFYKNNRLNVDLTAGYRYSNWYSATGNSARHTLDDGTHLIEREAKKNGDGDRINFRLGSDYTLRNEDRLSVSYLLNHRTSDARNRSVTDFVSPEGYTVGSLILSDTKEDTHNAHIEYRGHGGYTVGGDYIRYRDRTGNDYTDFLDGTTLTNYLYDSEQKISHWKLFSNYDIDFSERSTLNVGFNGGYYTTRSFTGYLPQDGNTAALDPDSRIRQSERTVTVFGDFTHRFNDRTNLKAALQAEYFNSCFEDEDQKRTLWNEWSFFPDLSITDRSPKGNITQLTLSTDKRYPGYWALNPQSTQVDPYEYIAGNPEVKPSMSYHTQLAYILKSKYTFVAFATIQPDYSAQMPHQDPDELKFIYTFVNLKRNTTAGVTAMAPVRAGNFYSLDISANGFLQKQVSDDYFGQKLDRSKLVGVGMLKNNFRIRREYPQVTLNIDFRYQSNAIQGYST